jgi:hypothetical protein
MSAGLDASTVTPGNTPPDVSFTIPAMVPCAKAAPGRKTAKNRIEINTLRIFLLR